MGRLGEMLEDGASDLDEEELGVRLRARGQESSGGPAVAISSLRPREPDLFLPSVLLDDLESQELGGGR